MSRARLRIEGLEAVVDPAGSRAVLDALDLLPRTRRRGGLVHVALRPEVARCLLALSRSVRCDPPARRMLERVASRPVGVARPWVVGLDGRVHLVVTIDGAELLEAVDEVAEICWHDDLDAGHVLYTHSVARAVADQVAAGDADASGLEGVVAEADPVDAGGEEANVWLEGGGDVVVLAFPKDRRVIGLVKALVPGRQWDPYDRIWWAPAGDGARRGVRALLREVPWLVASEDVRAWIAVPEVWSGVATVGTGGDGPAVLIATLSHVLPPQLAPGATPMGGDWTAHPLDRATVRAVQESLPAESVDSHARRAFADVLAGRPPAALRVSTVREEGETMLVVASGWDRPAWHDIAALPEAEIAGDDDADARVLLRGDDLVARVPADLWSHERLVPHFRGRTVAFSDAAARIWAELEEQRALADELAALSNATDADIDVPRLGGELRPFQRAAVLYATRRRRILLCDEQGLGKTVEALASLEADGAFPAIVVCPASLKRTWEAEARRWLPHRTIEVRSGRGLGAERPVAADLAIVNYDVLSAHGPALATSGARGLVLDESHHVKNSGAARTKAAVALSEALDDEALRIALTGTPVLNRPEELVAQLRAVGRLSEFGSGARFKRRFRDPATRERLHWRLRSSCYVRRTKAEVLPQLPAKRQAVVPLELDNEREYRRAEDDVIAWLSEQPLPEEVRNAKVAAALRAEHLVRIGALKRLAALGKLHSAIAWLRDFAASGEPIVVFAHLRDVQDRLLEAFPEAGHVLGRDDVDRRHDAVERFQRGESPLLVCSLQAAGQGLTLTRASNVAFLELGWTPAVHAQAEDRCHRLGQDRSVTAWYLLAADTIDETIAELLARKRTLVDAVTDGRDLVDGPLVDHVVASLRRRAAPAGMAA